MKKICSLFLSVIIVSLSVAICFTALAQGQTISDFSFNVYGKAADSMDTIHWQQTENVYYMYLPSDADLQHITVYYTADNDVYVGETKLINGGETDVFNVENQMYQLKCGDKDYNLFVMRSSGLPAVYLTTESGSLSYINASKDNKEGGKIRIYNNGSLIIDAKLKQIKGRGNATWNFSKKPYNIKFKEATDLFGMGAAKKWTLLANVTDKTLIRNTVAMDMGRLMGLSYTT